MTEPVIIGLDAGTSVIKAVTFDGAGNQLAQAARPNRIQYLAGGGVVQDMRENWQTTCAVLQDLAGQVPGLARRAAALAITGQGDGTWLIDADGEPVAPAWLWLDARSGPIVRELRAGEIGPAVYRHTGTGLNTALQSGHLLWLERHQPELLARATTAFHCKDWLYFKCCGERATDLSEGLFTYGDFRTGRYNDEVLALLGLTAHRRLLPELVDGSRHHDRMSPEAARATGLPAGTPVVLAPVDILCNGLGGGMYEPDANVGFTVLGSTGIHMRVYHGLDEIELHDQAGYTMVFVVPNTWVGLMSNMAATLNIDWWVDNVATLVEAVTGRRPERQALLGRLDQLAGEAQPGQLLYHPFLFESGERGPFVNPQARAQFLGLTSRAGFADLYRAIYESLGFAARDCYEGLGHRPDEIRVGGGAMRSALIRRILAAVLGIPLRLVEQTETGAAGAAMVACLALGYDRDAAAVCRRWVSPRLAAREPPEPALAAFYDRLMPVYRQGYRAMGEFWQMLAEVRDS